MSNGKGKFALVVGGGPAPGINGVISAVTIEAIQQGIEVIGFLDGFKWLVEGSLNDNIPLTIDEVTRINRRGGSILRTSRTNPTKPPELMKNGREVSRKMGITKLVTIGGDDT